MAEPTVNATDELPPETVEFYRHTMRVLNDASLPYLVGGAYAFHCYTDIFRHTKDFDLFVKASDVDRAMEVLSEAGYHTEFTFSHWLAKAVCGDDLVDLIFKSGNGISEVDDGWFSRARKGEVFGMPVLLCAPEEIIWTKAYIMERERFDGADVAHIFRGYAEHINWERLLELFGAHWRVLFAHVVLFGFIYPGERNRIPAEIRQRLFQRLQDEYNNPPPAARVCQGTLLSRAQYLVDITRWDYEDARLAPRGDMTEQQIDAWTEAIAKDGDAKSLPR
jgi:hypothetical protein